MPRTTNSIVSGLRARGLRVQLQGSQLPIVDDLDFDLEPGKLLGVVGESGSGKTTLGLALLRFARPGLELSARELVVGGVDLSPLGPAELQAMRGRLVSYVPQDAASALNPGRRIGDQLTEMLTLNGWEGSIEERITQVVHEVKLPGDPEFLRRFPFELSGGQQQRVGIAMAFACRPAVVVMDEITTGLDVLTQSRVLQTVKELVEIHRCSGIYISHDLSVVASIVDEVAVMYAGSIVEIGPVASIFGAPRHPYTSRLIESIPDFNSPTPPRGIPGTAPSLHNRGDGCRFMPRCLRATTECASRLPELAGGNAQQWRCIHPLPLTECGAEGDGQSQRPAGADDGEVLVRVSGLTAAYHDKKVLHGIDLEIRRGHCLGLLGESGSGKTTLSRILAGVDVAGEGELQFNAAPLPRSGTMRTATQRRRISYVFQNPYNSLNPRRRIGESVAFPLRLLGSRDAAADHLRVERVLDLVGLPPGTRDKYPRELSGGERQRAAIARALVTEPEFLICDEVTSALDVSVQASIVRLLNRLRSEVGLAILFVTHDMALIGFVAEQIAVLQHGKLVEHGRAADVLGRPQHAYVQDLVENAMRLAFQADSHAPDFPSPTMRINAQQKG